MKIKAMQKFNTELEIVDYKIMIYGRKCKDARIFFMDLLDKAKNFNFPSTWEDTQELILNNAILIKDLH